MGVYIKGMEMPKSCSDCPFFVDGLRDANDEPCSACLAKEDNSSWGCGYEEIDGIDHMARRMDYCPLVEVSEPHGRLIDEAVVLEMIRKSLGIRDLSFLYNAEKSIVNEIFHAPTVIEAEDE